MNPQNTYVALLIVQALHLLHHRLAKRHISFAEVISAVVLCVPPWAPVPGLLLMGVHVTLIAVQLVGSFWIKRLSPPEAKSDSGIEVCAGNISKRVNHGHYDGEFDSRQTEERFTMKSYLAELLGTFVLVFAGTGAIIINDVSGGAISHLGIAITFGLVGTAVSDTQVISLFSQPVFGCAIGECHASFAFPKASDF